MTRSVSGQQRTIAITLMGAVGLLLFGLGAVRESPISGTEPYTAVFADAGAILDGSDVKIAGVRAGSVTGLDVVDGQAHIRFAVDRGFLPLHEDATFEVRPVSLLGERYVDVDPGTADAPAVEPGTTFPATSTSRAVELDDVLNALDDPTAASLASLVSALGGGMADRGEDVQALLDTLAPSLRQTDELVGILDDQNAVLQQMVESLAPVTTALGANRGQRLDEVVGSATDLFAATDVRQQQLETAIRRLPSTLRTARSSLEELAGLADQATGTLRDVRPVTTDLQSIARELEDFAATADPALASLDPVLAHGQELVDELRPVAAALRPAGDDLTTVTGNVRPIADTLVEKRDAFFDFIRNWALTTNGSDGVSHYFRVAAVPEPNSVPVPLGGIEGLLPASDGSAGSGSAGDVVGDLTDTVGDVTGSIGDAVDDTVSGVTGALGSSTVESSSSDPDSVTGLSEDQEQGLVDFLLGGG